MFKPLADLLGSHTATKDTNHVAAAKPLDLPAPVAVAEEKKEASTHRVTFTLPAS